MNRNGRELLKFYEGKKILVTGNTGFKGSWLTHLLLRAGADVAGYALRPSAEPNLFQIAELDRHSALTQYYADVRDLRTMKEVLLRERPAIVFHLAAQPIVRDSFKDPVTTYSTNVMGTVNICEAIRTTAECGGRPAVRSFLNVTTDKVYKNHEWCYGYREEDELDGFDPYSNSKSCSELVTHSYKNCFFQDKAVRISTARAGNVIGGGDFSNDRIIPDCVRAALSARERGALEGIITVRNPGSTRPYEHVLEPLFAYLLIAARQYEDEKWSGYYNVGPDDRDCVSTGALVDLFTSVWNDTASSELGVTIKRKDKCEANPLHEANFLKLDCSKLKAAFQWTPRWHIEEAVKAAVAWNKVWMSGGDVVSEMDREIEAFISN